MRGVCELMMQPKEGDSTWKTRTLNKIFSYVALLARKSILNNYNYRFFLNICRIYFIHTRFNRSLISC